MDRQDHDERHDGAAHSGPYAYERERLVAMSTLESWTVSDGEPDIRGWEVRTIGGRQLGAVGDLLIDDGAGEVVFLDIDLANSDRRTFVPLRVVYIDRDHRTILMDSADLPASDTSRGDRAAASGRRTADGGTIRYPARDREVARECPQIADEPAPQSQDASGYSEDGFPDRSAAERRRGARRRIDRMSTGF